MKIGIVGLGVVGNAIHSFFKDAIVYDKYKPSDSFEKLLDTDIVFLCLPTLFDLSKKCYDCQPIHETLDRFYNHKYTGLLVIKSTVEPGTTTKFLSLFPSLRICHNPEFLSARSSVQDFENQKILIIGKPPHINVDVLISLFPNIGKRFICLPEESESTKIFCNSFYAAKIQIFNEFYDVCQKTNMSFEKIRELMIAIGWIHPMHTEVPGSDNQLSFGGMCFPKDISACIEFLELHGAKSSVLRAAKEERDSMRTDK